MSNKKRVNRAKKRLSNPRTGMAPTGIVDRIKAAEDLLEIGNLMEEARSYENISPATLRRAYRASYARMEFVGL